ncbi:ABC transporter ATP-binding protein [Microbacterium halotolerans]|uniref:ABC transporter ATP-binding protein n=1 Tax=Microbacterium halotolerans TaxID=246613 RepID=UPI001F09B4D1|nr:ABC transporter ATP-binding protein [Microbacterium halotolerans]
MTSESRDESRTTVPSNAHLSDEQASARSGRGAGASELSVDTRENPVVAAPLPPLPETDAAEAAARPVAGPPLEIDADQESALQSPEGAEPASAPSALRLTQVTKSYGGTDAVTEIDLTVPSGAFYGLVGPNGAGKTTLLSMIAGLLSPTAGTLEVCGVDLRKHPREAKKLMGVLPDRLRTFDRLTGRQLLYYVGVLRGLKPGVIADRTNDLARVLELTDALGRVVSDYSAGMTKKIMLAAAMIHSPRLLVLDEPFEAVDPVSSETILGILSEYVRGGGTVVLSSHGMDLVEQVCSRLAVIVSGQVLAEGTVEEVKGSATLTERFVELSGATGDVGGLEWLHASSN